MKEEVREQGDEKGVEIRESPNQWADTTVKAWAYGHDSVKEIERAFDESDVMITLMVGRRARALDIKIHSMQRSGII